MLLQIGAPTKAFSVAVGNARVALRAHRTRALKAPRASWRRLRTLSHAVPYHRHAS